MYIETHMNDIIWHKGPDRNWFLLFIQYFNCTHFLHNNMEITIKFQINRFTCSLNRKIVMEAIMIHL